MTKPPADGAEFLSDSAKRRSCVNSPGRDLFIYIYIFFFYLEMLIYMCVFVVPTQKRFSCESRELCPL